MTDSFDAGMPMPLSSTAMASGAFAEPRKRERPVTDASEEDQPNG